MNDFLSCDWGTSNFRLRLISGQDLEVIDEVTSDQGVSEVYKEWKSKNDSAEEGRIAFYKSVLKKQVAALIAKNHNVPPDLPIVISGMATSTIGLINLPYQHLPVPTDGSGLQTHQLKGDNDLPNPITLISGLRSHNDVMRGEETQLLGTLTSEMQAYEGAQLIVHPGTHSKHIHIDGGMIIDFQTYMTGEFFKLLSTQGILRDNVSANSLTEDRKAAFRNGVSDVANAPLLHAAFLVRTNDLFSRYSKEDNYHYLSGLLIGTELQQLKSCQLPIHLCAGPGLHASYKEAIEAMGLAEKVAILPPEWEEGAVVRGQAKILDTLSHV